MQDSSSYISFYEFEGEFDYCKVMDTGLPEQPQAVQSPSNKRHIPTFTPDFSWG